MVKGSPRYSMSMRSETRPKTHAVFYDGKTAAEHRVSVELAGDYLHISGDSAGTYSWPLAGLRAHDLSGGTRDAASLGHDDWPDAQLDIADKAFTAQIIARAPALQDNPGGRIARWAVVSVVVIGLIGMAYWFSPALTRHGASYMPFSWRDSLGARVEASLTRHFGLCSTPETEAVLEKLKQRLRWPSDEPVRIKIWRLPIANGFTLPGNRILLTTGLIRQVELPEELAGVVAHEFGHAAMRHPSQGLIGALGLTVITTTLFGGTSGFGKNLSEAGGMIALLRNTRAKEIEADKLALKYLEDADIDPAGLAVFFQRLMKSRLGKTSSQTLERVGSLLRTHPNTADRIALFKSTPGKSYRPALDKEDWATLKRHCSASKAPAEKRRDKPGQTGRPDDQPSGLKI